MRAVRLHQRGGPEQVVIEDAPLPAPGAGEIRIRVRACAITPGELTWDQTYQHADGSVRLPTIPGHDVAGIVDAIGPGVNDVAQGEAVFALINFPRDGSAAEYAIVPAGDTAPAPRTIDLAHAAAVPLSALTAWQGLFEHGKLVAGQRVLIHGGAGGVGTFAVQLAKCHGVHVVATASTANVDSVRKLGADEVIDYTAAGIARVQREFDLVFDTVGGAALDKSYDLIRRGGRLVSIAGMPDQKRAAENEITGTFFIVRPNRVQLQEIADFIDTGKMRVEIQQIYPLAEARQAFERSVAGHLRGKIVLDLDPAAGKVN